MLLWFVPHNVFAATLTKNILHELGVYDKSWQGFLQESDTTTWQCGKIGGNSVRYRIKGDVIGYDEVNHLWWHLFTPVSTAMPIEALALRMSEDGGAVTSQTVTLRKSTCKSLPEKRIPIAKDSVEKKVMAEKPIVAKKQETTVAKPVAKKPQAKSAPEKTVVKSVTKDAVTGRKVAPVVQKKISKTDTPKFSSTRAFLKAYRKQVEGE